MTIDRVGKGKTNFPWAIIEMGGYISQARFESKEAAQIAYRNYTLGRN